MSAPTKATDASGKLLMDKAWEMVQKKTFTKWVNSHLAKRGQKLDDISVDFKDGLQLLSFLEIIGNHKFTTYEKKPKIRIQFIQNNMLALKYLKDVKVPLVNITAEDITDANQKLILGMIWTIIQRFQINDISEEELSAKEALLLWCKKKTAGYRDCKVDNFHTSWQDGMAFLALIHKHRPDLVDYDNLKKENAKENLQLAFDIAEKHLGIAKLLDVEDIVDVPRPDEHSMITYIAQFYHAFSSNKKQEVAGRRIGRLVDSTLTNEQMKADYNDRSKDLVGWIEKKTEEMKDRNFPNDLSEIKKVIDSHLDYKVNEKPPKGAEKLALEALFNSLALKLRNTGREAFVAPDGTSIADINNKWDNLSQEERDREDALTKELERQEQIDLLNRRLRAKADKLEAWIASKQKYLNKEETADSVGTAQTKVNEHEQFYEEHAASKARLDELEELTKQLEALNDPKLAETKERVGKISENWNGLVPTADEKKKRLRKMLDIQIRMEELRLDFAKQAKEYNLWVNTTVDRMNNHSFAETLEGVEAEKSELDENDAKTRGESDTKKAALDKLWEDMKEIGIKDNQYSAFTNEDIEKRHQAVEEGIKKRQAAYDAELARQVEMENMRKEFARLAQEFVDSLNQRQAEVKGHLNAGEPEEAITAINAAYDDGKPEKAKLEPLTALNAQMSEAGINRNKHTEYSLNILEKRRDRFANTVAHEVALLIEEKELKAEYLSKVEEFLNFVRETTPQLQERNFDNTLNGARAQSAQLREYKTGKKTEYAAKKPEIEALYRAINDVLKSNKRPDFKPPAGSDLDSIDSQWADLGEEEKKKEADIQAELSRQEKLAYLVRRFNSDAEDLESWTGDKEKYLAEREIAESLFKAQFNLRLFDAYSTEFKGRENYFSQLADLANEIKSLNYNDIATVDGRRGKLEEVVERLRGAADGKKTHLEEQLKNQQGHEDLRVEFARLAKEFNEWVKKSAEAIRDYNFGLDLGSVTSYKEELDKSDKQYSDDTAAKKAQLDSVHDSLLAAGIKDNRHTKLTSQDVASFSTLLHDELAKRQAAYDAELKKQQQFDERRKEFAGKADEFVGFLGDARKNLEEIAGTADEKKEKVAAAHNGGAGAQTHLDSLAHLSTDMKSQGIYGNDHTKHTLPSLTARNRLHNNYVNNLEESIKEEKGLEEKMKAQEAEQAKRQKNESLVVEFSQKARALNHWMESVEDSLDDPVNASSLAEADKLAAAHAAYDTEREAKTKDHEALIELANRMKEAGITDFSGVTMEDITEKWIGVIGAGEEKKKAIDAELEKQRRNDAIAHEFADSANAINTYMEDERKSLAGNSGDLDTQLANVMAQTNKYEQTGRKLMKDLEDANQKVSQNAVRPGQYTKLAFRDLQLQFEQLKSSIDKADKLIASQIEVKKGGDLTAEQVSEFKEVFQHFDRDGNGVLNRLEIKSVLASMGEEPSDAELDKMMTELDPEKKGGINFDSFASFMKNKSKDQDTKEEIVESFKSISNDREFVTEEDMRKVMDNAKVDYLLKSMPKYEGVDNGYDYKKWADKVYA